MTLPADSVVLNMRQPVTVPLRLQALDTGGSIVSRDFSVEIRRTETANGEIGGQVESMSILYMVDASLAGEFEVNLLPGTQAERTYRMKIDSPATPSSPSERFPPVYFDGITISDKGEVVGIDGEVIDVLTTHMSSLELSGRVERDGEAESHMYVVAVDPATGRQVSTETETIDVTGDGENFEIYLADGLKDFKIVASRPGTPWYPTIEKDHSEGEGLSDVVLAGSALPSPEQYHATVTRSVTWSDGVEEFYGVGGCTVIFESEDAFGGSASRIVSTDASGSLISETGAEGIYLYSADYSLTVIPPTYNAFYLNGLDVFYSETDLPINEESSGQVFGLGARSLIYGTILTEGTQLLVPEGLLRAEPLEGTPVHARDSYAAVDSEGKYSIWVDKGDTYRFVLESPLESKYAWSAFSRPSAPDQYDITLPIPFVARLQLAFVSDPDAILSGALVEVFEEVEGKYFMVGRSVSDEIGLATVLLQP